MYDIIINPAARSGAGRKTWKKVKKILEQRHVKYWAFFTDGPGDAKRIAGQLTSQNRRVKLIVIGGDGTLHETISGIKNWEQTSLGYIPIGSGNDFARGIQWRKSSKWHLEHILNDSDSENMDCAKARTDAGTGRFMVSAGIGYDAGICNLVNRSKLKKGMNKLRLGKWTYWLLGVYALFTSERFRGELELDGRRKVFLNHILFCSVHNLPYEGGGVPFCPKADPKDGKLDVCVISGLPRRKLPVLLIQALRGKHTRYRGVHVYRCQSVKIHARRPQYFHMDGEVIGKVRKAEIHVEKGRVHML